MTKESVFQLPFIGIITRDVLGSIGVSRKKKHTMNSSSSSSSGDTIISGGGDDTAVNNNSNNNDIHNGNANGNANANDNNNLIEQIMEQVHNDNDNTTNASHNYRQGPIVIFPEGTTTNGTCLLHFKKGAFVPLVDVVPICYCALAHSR